VALPVPLEIVTFIASWLQLGHVKTVGSFFFTTLMTRLRRLPTHKPPKAVLLTLSQESKCQSFKHSDAGSTLSYAHEVAKDLTEDIYVSTEYKTVSGEPTLWNTVMISKSYSNNR
jgi:hypothetical protein